MPLRFADKTFLTMWIPIAISMFEIWTAFACLGRNFVRLSFFSCTQNSRLGPMEAIGSLSGRPLNSRSWHPALQMPALLCCYTLPRIWKSWTLYFRLTSMNSFNIGSLFQNICVLAELLLYKPSLTRFCSFCSLKYSETGQKYRCSN